MALLALLHLRNLERTKTWGKRAGTRNIRASEERTEGEGSIEDMDIPFRRIVVLTTMGLVTGAVLRLIYQALRETKS